MKKKRKYLILLVLFSFMILFAGCEKIVDRVIGINGKNIYENDEKIKGNSSSFSMNGNKFNMIDNNINGEFEYFSGLYPFLEIDSDGENKVDFKIDIESKTEDFKIVLVNSEKDIIILAEGSTQQEGMLNLTDGENLFKMVGKGGKVKFNLELGESKSIELKFLKD